MSRDALAKRAEKALRGLFRESFRRMDDELPASVAIQ